MTELIIIHLTNDLHLMYFAQINMEYNSELEVALQDLKLLARDGTVAGKMMAKLQYLESVILELGKEQQFMGLLPEFQQMSLQQMNREGQIQLFINLVKCLGGKEVIEYFGNQKATIRKEQTFAGWNSCFLTCNSQSITVFKKVDSKEVWNEFQLDKLFISKVYRRDKKRHIFGIAYGKHKYQVGFEQEGTCARIHGIIINLIRQRRTLRDRLKGVRNSQLNGSEMATQLQFQKENENESGFEYDYDEEDNMGSEEREFLGHVQERVMGYELADNGRFQLVRNIEKGRILEDQSDGSFKLCLLMEKMDVESIIERFIEFPQWNSYVESFKIVNRIRSNTFLAFLKLKKHNLLSYPRETHLTITYIKTCACLAQKDQKKESKEYGKHYLLMNSVDNNTNAAIGTVKMNIQQIVQFSFLEDSPQTVFMVLWSKMDFRGYDYFNYNREMNLQYFHDFAFLSTYCRQAKSKSVVKTFDLQYCACKIQRQRQRQRKDSYQSDASFNKEEEQIKPLPIKEKSLNVISAIENCHSGNFSDDILRVIKQRHFQRYYLKHRFSQEIQNDEYKVSRYTYRHHKDFLLQNGRWKLINNNLIFCNQEVLKAQKGVLKMILKQIGSNLMSGKSIMNMSLPVQIFDRKSMLQVLCNMMGFFPRFIHDAVSATDPVEQIKYVAMSYLFVNSCFPNVEKPFNPILGETFQGLLGGIPIYLEQTFHHPPISTVFMKTNEFETHGNFDMHVDMGLNSAYSKVSSHFTVKIPKSKTEYIIKLADVQLGGVSFGDRTLRAVGRGFAYEKTNNIYCEWSVGKDKKKVYEYSHKLKNCDLAGGVFKVTPTFGKKLLSADRSKSFEGVKFDDIIEKYCHISGKWYGDISFDNIPYKTVENGPFPVRVQRQAFLLPSDSLFREDIIFKNRGELTRSNEAKQVLENLQRKDKKLRERYRPT